jgi:hypothetical protein
MTQKKEDSFEDIMGLLDAQRFLEIAGDEELRIFLSRLPMVAANDAGSVSMEDLIYEMKIWPFVKQAWSDVEGSPGIPGRLLQLARVYKKAESDFEQLTGETRRHPRVIDLPSFTKIYAATGLPRPAAQAPSGIGRASIANRA